MRVLFDELGDGKVVSVCLCAYKTGSLISDTLLGYLVLTKVNRNTNRLREGGGEFYKEIVTKWKSTLFLSPPPPPPPTTTHTDRHTQAHTENNTFDIITL